MFIYKRGPAWSRRLGGLITAATTLVLIMSMALPSWAASLSIDLPFAVVRADPGSRVLLHTESVPDALVGQTCSAMATGINNESVHPGNNIEIVSGNTVTLFGVEDVANKTTMADGVLSLTETITVILVMGEEDGVYSAALSILLDCTAGTTTTTVAGTSTSTTEGTTTTTTEGTTTTTEATTTTSIVGGGSITSTTEATTTTTIVGIVVSSTTSSTVPDVVGGITVTTDPGDVLAGTLPFTGPDTDLLGGLGASVLALGVLILMAGREEES